MDKKLLVAVAGLLAVVGCFDFDNDVMGNRGYVPAAIDDPKPITVAPIQNEIVDLPAQPEVAKTDAPAMAFEPMTGVVSSGGVGEIPGKAAKGGEYIVKKGDTLGRIAQMHGVKLTDLMSVNNLTSKNAKRLRIGKKLIIPDGKTIKKVSAKNTDSGKKTAVKLDADGFYVVKSGDTPERIARRNNVKLTELMKVNNLTSESARRMQVGDKLIIPGKTTAGKTVEPVQTPAVDTAEPALTPVVVPDTATAAETPVTAPETAVTEPVTVEADADIAQETTPVVAEEDISVDDFAKKHNTTVEFIRKHNPSVKGDMIKANEPIFVPVATSAE